MISCSNMMAPNDEELFAYVVDDETLDEESLHHLEHCPICQLRLKDYQRTHERLLSRLYRTLCPDPTQLLGIFIYDSEEQIKAFEGSLVELYQLEHVSTSTEMTPSDIPAEKPFLSTSVDHMGHFSFSPLPTRTYTIRVHLPDTELLIEQVKLE